MQRRLVPLSLVLAACAHGAPPAPAPAPAPVRVDSLPPVLVQTPPTAPAPASRSPRQPGARTPRDPFARIDHMDAPGPNRYRSASGEPGPDYWQQRADYVIAATLDTATTSIRGHVAITYTNASPDTLHFVWLQLDQNLFRPGSVGSDVFPQSSRWGVRGFPGGYTIRGLSVDGRPAVHTADGTMMRVILPTALPPHGGRTTIAMRYSFAVPEHGSDRMGRDGPLYEIAQWYPRMAVYDDVRGWNTDPYLGQGEFYLEYGDIDYAVTVPAGYTVAGSGVLQNPGAVLSATERERLQRAAGSAGVVSVITEREARATPTPGTKTWRFRARNVRDVAWAAAPDFRWDATNWRGVLCQSFYEYPKAGPQWEHAAEMTRWSIRTYSRLIRRFPYPQASTVAGPVGGMEYPMFVMVNYQSQETDPTGIFGTIDHEQGHEWFPMTVGSNERRYAWMDEGINTYINAFSLEARFPRTSMYPAYLGDWEGALMSGADTPIMTPPDRISPAVLGSVGYRKPAIVLLALRDHVVGRRTFDEAMRAYADRWAFKHPTPADFFRTIENYTGRDLSWFWHYFFYTTDVLDIGIDSVATRTVGGAPTALVTVTRHTPVPFPVELRFALADGTTQDVHLPVEIWYGGRSFTAAIAVRAPVVGARLWPVPTVPDFDPANDSWGRAPAADPMPLVTARGLSAGLGAPSGHR